MIKMNLKDVLKTGAFALVLGAAGFCQSAGAAVISDENTSVTISPASGITNWTVDGVNQLSYEWFFYRIGTTGGEANVSTLNVASTVDAGFAYTINFDNSNKSSEQQFTLSIQWLVTGGTAGSGTSDLLTNIHLANISEQPMDLHFFQYADFDLNGTPAGDTVSITGANTATQSEAGVNVGETVDTPTPDHYTAQLFNGGALLTSLTDGSPTTLDDVAGPVSGDVLWAFQWDRTLDASGLGSSLVILKDQLITPVPEPASIALMGAGVVMIAARKRRRHA